MTPTHGPTGPRRMLRQAGYAVGLISVLSGLVNLLILVSPIYMFQVFDRVLLTYHLETLVYLSLIAGVCVLVLGAFDALRGTAVARLGRWWDETLRPQLLSAALARARVGGPQAGVALADLQVVRGFVGGAHVLPFFDAPWTPLLLLGIFVLHPALGVVALVAAAVLLLLAIAHDAVSRAGAKGLAAENAANGLFAATALRNADVVHAMGMQKAVVGLHESRQRETNGAAQSVAEKTALFTGLSKAIRVGVQIAMLGVGAYLVTRQQLTAGAMIASTIVLGRALAPIEQAIGSWRAFTAAREAHGRITALLDSAPPAETPTALPAPKGELAVENVSLVLPGIERPVLRQINFSLQSGTVLAVVGPSAAGKSSLCRVLVGSWRPTAGLVRLDGADLAQYSEEDRSRYVGYLPQSIELFGGTVRQNIARFGDATDVEVIDAAQRAGCHEMILRLPRGYDTEIGDGGAFLSGGQRQRIGLARALLGDTRLVILDEPNSNLDQWGESALIAAINELKQRGTTVVLISHRLTMMQVVDMVALLRDGTIEKIGPRDTMLADLQAVRPVPTQRVVNLARAPQS